MAFTLNLLCLILFFASSGSFSNARRHRDFHRLQIVYEPISQMILDSVDKASFKCRANPEEAEITWFFNGKIINLNDPLFNVTKNKLIVHLPKNHTNSKISDNQRSSLLSYNVANDGTTLQGSIFQCQAKYKSHAILSEPAKLIIATLSPFPYEEDVFITVFEGNTAVIPCSPPHSVPYAITEFVFNVTKIYKSDGKISYCYYCFIFIAKVIHFLLLFQIVM